MSLITIQFGAMRWMIRKIRCVSSLNQFYAKTTQDQWELLTIDIS